MQTLANILPAADPESLRNRVGSQPSSLSGPAHESFADLMSRTRSAASSDTQGNGAGQDAPLQKPFPAHKQTRASSPLNKSPSDKSLVESGSGSPALLEASLTTLDGKPLLKATDADPEKNSGSPVAMDASLAPEDAQSLLMQMIAPVLVLSLPRTVAPRPAGTSPSPADISISTVDMAKNPAPAAGAAMGVENLISPADALKGLKAGVEIAAAFKQSATTKINPPETRLPESINVGTAMPTPAEADGKNLSALNLSAVETEPLPVPENSAAPASNKDLAASATFQIHGTPAAQQVVPMKNENNTNKVAGLGEKVLPGKLIPVASEKNLPGRGSFVVPINVVAGNADTTAAANSMAAGQGVAAAGALDNSPVSSNVIDLPARALDRTHDMVALHAVRLVEAKTDSLQVVIKPGAGIELSLELRQHDGGIEAHAVLQAGDFNQMNQHWADLQQRLEQRGIRLAPLTGDENSTSFGGNTEFQKQQQPPEQDPLAAGAFAEFALATAMTALTGQRAAYASALRGWQSWA
jgi:hypothetical protein